MKSKKYCGSFEKNFCKCGRLIDSFCKHYKGDKTQIESCAYKWEKIKEG